LIQIHLIVPAAQAEILSDLLFDTGALAVTFNDAANEEIFAIAHEKIPLWQQTRVTALFEPGTVIETILASLRKKVAADIIATQSIENLPEQDWVATIQKNFQPMRFGKHLWVCPSWHSINEKNAVIIQLDPGMAFGTGTHPTTALCLEWLANHMQPKFAVIDYGCGSGILAIAAAKLGAKPVWATDIDPQAIAASEDNAQRNQISKSQLTISAEAPEWQADILVANILALPLIELAAKFATLVKPKGKIVLSGILEEQAKEVSKTYQVWFNMQPAIIKDGWVLLQGTRR
jgi:ribosomal protein L11 methyltransferase